MNAQKSAQKKSKSLKAFVQKGEKFQQKFFCLTRKI